MISGILHVLKTGCRWRDVPAAYGPPTTICNRYNRWQRRIKAVIPSTATRRTPYPLDKRTDRRRNVIERAFCRLKNWRRIATRHDRHAANDLAGIALVAAVAEWIK